ncbi:MAG: DUF1015 domain-containing protein [Oscillospiraceae bacterium]|nr:DUF1015 domain-containing protein [Oscillospiraceae bacterium]
MGTLFHKTHILLPKEQVDLRKWTVIACDQFTSEPEFWERVKETAGDGPSTLHMILPEAWLGVVDEAAMTKEINATMAAYLAAETFREVSDSLVYVERRLRNGQIRRGVVGAIDLEAYDTEVGSKSQLKATERIIHSRLPARVEIRRNAPLEIPHVLVLIDDPKCEIIEGIDTSGLERLYDFALMENCGHLTGYRLTEAQADAVTGAINALPIILVGDGNHSLVAAKMNWDEKKVHLSEAERERHPARFALVEINNVHEESLEIEPIYRIVFDAAGDLIGEFVKSCPQASLGEGDGQAIRYIDRGVPEVLTLKGLSAGETIDALQVFLDEYVERHGGEIDYIHGEAELRELAERPGSIAFFMPPILKSDLFDSVIRGGVFPKKSFSMGEGADKRHYLECRTIG